MLICGYCNTRIWVWQQREKTEDGYLHYTCLCHVRELERRFFAHPEIMEDRDF